MPEPTMPDPWGPPSVVTFDVTEAPIREVLSRLSGLVGQLNDYARTAIDDGSFSTETGRARLALDVLVDAADDALLAWGRWLTVGQAPEAEEPHHLVVDGQPPIGSHRPAAEPDKVVDLMAALEESVAAAKAARPRRAMTSDVPEGGTVLRHRTPDQVALAETHRRLQRGD